MNKLIYNITDDWTNLRIWIKINEITPNKDWWLNFSVSKKNVKREWKFFSELDNLF
jgi:hypothetical protein